MRVVDSRRVTGANLVTRDPGAVAEIAFEGVAAGPDGDAARAGLIDGWRHALGSVLVEPTLTVRHFRGGAALFVAGAVETLLPLTELNEWAIATATAHATHAPLPLLDPTLLPALAEARLPGLAELIAAARAHDLPLLIDEEAITLGAGRRMLRYSRHGPLPAGGTIDWDALGRIPIGIVTGTNGKTTTTRLAARMVRASGRVAGLTSSDGVMIGDVITHRGDYSGPEGTRTVLRHPEVEVAILETARGGILRRGLTVEHCDAAVITNVSADHLGDYGVDDVATMARVKGVVARDARTVILNANDPALVALAARDDFAASPDAPRALVWVAREPDAPDAAAVLAPHRAAGGTSWVIRNGALGRERGGTTTALLAVDAIPIAFGGHAAYNLENALAAAALAHALGVPDAAIVASLRDFTSSAVDNPGRGNLVQVNGVAVLVDFGHNAVAIKSVVALARGLLSETGGSLRVTIGMPGDRTTADIAAIAVELAAAQPVQVIVRELPPGLLRGREPGGMTALILAQLERAGLPRDALALVASEPAAVAMGLAASREGDLVLVLVHVDPTIEALLASAG